MMKSIGMWVMVALMVVSAAACDSSGGGDKAEAPKAGEAKKEAPAEVKLTAKGEKFDPPIEKSAVPDGAWFCDMGTVHYARSEEGDGKCPVCKMDLKHKGDAHK